MTSWQINLVQCRLQYTVLKKSVFSEAWISDIGTSQILVKTWSFEPDQASETQQKTDGEELEDGPESEGGSAYSTHHDDELQDGQRRETPPHGLLEDDGAHSQLESDLKGGDDPPEGNGAAPLWLIQ